MGRSVAVIVVLAVAAPATATAKLAPITGQLSRPGYTVIALAKDGKASLARSDRAGRFAVRPRGRRVTLHLRSGRARYAGPVVVGAVRRRTRAVLGVRAGTHLGRIRIVRAEGYARVVKPARRWLGIAPLARAEDGVPIGAGTYGRVGTGSSPRALPSDGDVDGIPDPFDVDDDGDLVLDNFDADSVARAAQASCCGPPLIGGRAHLHLDLADAVNANTGSSRAAIDDALRRFGNVLAGSQFLQIDPGTVPELECGDPDTGLVYCRANGSTGTTDDFFGFTAGAPWPACCDDDRDGSGSLHEVPGTVAAGRPTYVVQIRHGATTADIRTGDVWIERAMIDGVETEFPGVLVYVFATVPALAAYADEAGHAATLAYPVAAGAPGTGPSGEAAPNGLPVADGPDADDDVEVRLTFWRPQRPAIAGETGEWTDVGRVAYTAATRPYGPGVVSAACPADAYSDFGPDLTGPASRPPLYQDALIDGVADRAASPANTFGVTVNLTRCLTIHSWLGSGSRVGELPVELTFSGTPADGIPGQLPDSASTSLWLTVT